MLGGTKLEMVHFDNKSSPQESVQMLKQITDSGIRYLTQGAGSNNAHANIANNKIEKFALDYRKKYGGDFYYNTAKTELEMLAKTMNDTRSADPLKVARALEGMKYQGDTGEVFMRADDHQIS